MEREAITHYLRNEGGSFENFDLKFLSGECSLG